MNSVSCSEVDLLDFTEWMNKLRTLHVQEKWTKKMRTNKKNENKGWPLEHWQLYILQKVFSLVTDTLQNKQVSLCCFNNNTRFHGPNTAWENNF